MSLLKVQDFDELITYKKLSPAYLFMGEESYLIDICLRKTEKFLDVNDLNKEVFYASESYAENILNSLRTLPFLSKRRMIVVRDVNKIKAVDADKLIDYLTNVVETSCLVLLYSDNYKKESVAKRKEFINKCINSKNCVCVDCRKRYRNEIVEFIRGEIALRGKTVSNDIISRIIDESNTDLLSISNEIEKLSLFVGRDKKGITQDDLEKIGGYTKEASVYALSSTLEAKNLKKSMFILEKLLNEGEEPVIILSAISSSVRKMLNAKSVTEEQNMSASETALKVGVNNFYTEIFFSNLEKHSTKILMESLKVILKADTAIKTGNNDALSVLGKVVLFICK